MSANWSEAEVMELWPLLTSVEQGQLGVLVEFCQRARDNPDSMWGPIEAWGAEGPVPRMPGEEELQTSEEVLADLEPRIGELLRVAVLRKGLRN